MKLEINGLRVDAGSGPGSRGGHVIGKTSSGKPIYASAKHPEHKEFSPSEHDEASVHHARASKKAKKEFEEASKQHKTAGSSLGAFGAAAAASQAQKDIEHHVKQWGVHLREAKKKRKAAK